MYDPWGSIVSESNAANGDRFKFDGGQYDSIQQTYLFTARWDRPQDGGWESPDPLGFKGGDSNLYRFVTNNPDDNIDPTGLAEVNIKVNGLVSKWAKNIGYTLVSNPLRGPKETVEQIEENFKQFFSKDFFKRASPKNTALAFALNQIFFQNGGIKLTIRDCKESGKWKFVKDASVVIHGVNIQNDSSTSIPGKFVHGITGEFGYSFTFQPSLDMIDNDADPATARLRVSMDLTLKTGIFRGGFHATFAEITVKAGQDMDADPALISAEDKK